MQVILLLLLYRGSWYVRRAGYLAGLEGGSVEFCTEALKILPLPGSHESMRSICAQIVSNAAAVAGQRWVCMMYN